LFLLFPPFLRRRDSSSSWKIGIFALAKATTPFAGEKEDHGARELSLQSVVKLNLVGYMELKSRDGGLANQKLAAMYCQ
jgi:hypothetical protein